MHPTLRLHDGSDDNSPELRHEVRALQQLLLMVNVFTKAPSGVFDVETQTAVQQFQRAHGLRDDGVVGPVTWAALDGIVFATSFTLDNAKLLAQLAAAAHYRIFAEAASAKFNIPLCVLAGIASRESGWGLALRPPDPSGTGDFQPRTPRPPLRPGSLPPDNAGFGRGLMQIDYDAHEFARTGAWREPAATLSYGASVLSDNRTAIKRATSLDGIELLRAALAAYNSGAGNVLKALGQGKDCDAFTTGRDYGKDTLNRAGWFYQKGWT